MEPQKPHTPFVVVDTGTLLTLLLGGETHQPGFAYATLLRDFQKEGLIRLVVPDMVASEFCGGNAPLYAEDIQRGRFTAENIPMGFAKPQQRVELLRSLLANGAQIMPTACGDEYLARIGALLAHNPAYRLQRDRIWPPEGEALRLRLTSPRSQLVKALRQNSFVDGKGLPVSSGRQDRGELAVADAIGQIQRTQGAGEEIFALFEGGDVRGRIIQRMRSAAGSEAYQQLSGQVLPRFNPNHPEFEADAAAKLGRINFLSTKGLMAGWMRAASALSPSRYVRGGQDWFVLAPDEARNKQALNRAYAELIGQVNANGLSRIYDKYRDRPIGELRRDDEHEYAMESRQPQNAPWMRFVNRCLEEPARRESLRGIMHGFVAYRQQALLEDAQLRFEGIMRMMDKMSGPVLNDYLSWLTQQLGQMRPGPSRRAA